jgi:ketosteroid isomerase-like protein
MLGSKAAFRAPRAYREILRTPEETVKIRAIVFLAGLAISFALPTLAQQKETVDPKIVEATDALCKKFDDAFNNNDAAAVAALFTKDGVLVTDSGIFTGPEAIQKYQEGVFKAGHFSNHMGKCDEAGVHLISADGKEVWRSGDWSLIWQDANDKNSAPVQAKGYWSAIETLDKDGNWKDKLQTWNITPAPAK